MSVASTTSIFCGVLGERDLHAAARDDDAPRQKPPGLQHEPQRRRAGRTPAPSRARVAATNSGISTRDRRSVPGARRSTAKAPSACVVVDCVDATAVGVADGDRARRQDGADVVDDDAGECRRAIGRGRVAPGQQAEQSTPRRPPSIAWQERSVPSHRRSLREQAATGRRRRGCVGQDGADAARSSAHFLSSQKVDRKNAWVGLLARKVRIERFDSRAASPSPTVRPSGHRSRAPSLTVAGPRRIHTGLPRYALVGTQADAHPTMGVGFRERCTRATRLIPIASPPSAAPTQLGAQGRGWRGPRRARQSPDRRRRRSAQRC